MNQIEMEKFILDPSEFEKLSQKVRKSYPALQSGAVTKASSKIKAVPTQTSISSEINPDKRGLISKASMMAKVGNYLPELRKKSPEESLQLLLKRYYESPSPNNQFLVQDAINRIATNGPLTEKTSQLIETTIRNFTTAFGSDPDITGGVFANLYQHADFRGTSTFAFLGMNSIYYGVRKSFLSNVGLHDSISSLSLGTTTERGRGDLILLQNDKYNGRFSQYRTDASGSSQTLQENYVGDYINDRTSSFLMIRRFDGEQIAALGTDLAKLVIRNTFDNIDEIRVTADPIFTWDMFPTGGDDHPNDPNKYFAQVKIPVVVDPPNWPWDYSAELRLWFYFYIENGDLKGYLAYYGAYVSGGLISGRVLDGIMDALSQKVGEINSLISTVINPINNGGPYRHVYLLPGDQGLFTGSKYQGHTEDNVSVVLVPQSIPWDFENVATELVY